MEKRYKKLFNSERKTPSKNLTSMEHDAKSIFKSEIDSRWYKDLTEKLIQKTESLDKAKEQVLKLTENKNVLLNKLKAKDGEIYKFNEKVALLLRELSALKTDHLKSLEEIKMLKIKLHEYARKNEVAEQKKSLYDEMQRELTKSQLLLTKEKWKIKNLETLKLNPHKWRTVQYTDPHYFETLQKKNYLQKELLKKMKSIQAKDVELDKRNMLLKNLQHMLERRPYHLMKDPNEQMMEYYKTTQLQKETIKVLTAQVNMFESVFSDQYHKLSNQDYANLE